jgi:formate dehydrogenase gamma subunit
MNTLRPCCFAILAVPIWFFVVVSNADGKPLVCLDCHDGPPAASVHNEAVECDECHEDVVDETHEDKEARPVNCGSCHEEVAEIANKDVHHRLKELVGDDPPECMDCHGSHDIRPIADNGRLAEKMCSGCHDNILYKGEFHRTAMIDRKVCLECHDDVEKHAQDLETSVHRELGCVDCHFYVATRLEEHQEELPFAQVSDCGLCHKDETLEHRESIHGLSIARGVNEAANCWNCHGSHGIQPVGEKNSKVYPTNLPATCGSCHDNAEFIEKFAMIVKEPGKLYSHSVHGELIEQGRMDAATCDLCHGVHDIKNRLQPGSRISTFRIPEDCGQCHGVIEEEYKQSIHWIRAKAGARDAPVCNDCHSEHSIRAITTLEKNSAIRKLQEESCFRCHQNPLVIRKYGLSGEQPYQYSDSYHGLAVLRGDPDAAMCVDCHGVHKILPKIHPKSSVNPKNVLTTCGKCHLDANVAFAQSYTHQSATTYTRAIEYWVKTIYVWVIVLVVGGMAIHNILVYSFRLRRKKREKEHLVLIPRFSANEVIQHYSLVLVFIVLVVTGFALKYPTSWLFNWLEWVGMTETIRQNTHRTAGVILLILGGYHVVYLLATERGRYALGAMALRLGDIKEAARNIQYNLGVTRSRPEVDQFGYVEKLEYWALVWGTLVMGVTGIVLWFPEDVAQEAPPWVISVSEIVHFYEAILATLAIIVWHGFFVIFHPDEYPMSLVMVDGKIPLDELREHHYLAFKETVDEWARFRRGEVERERLGFYTKMVVKALEKNRLNPDEILRLEAES